jgi:hypothetical protein
MSDIDLSLNPNPEINSATTLEVIKKIITAKEVDPYTLRMAFISVYSSVNQLYENAKKTRDSKMTTAKIRKDSERVVKALEVGFNVPLEVRVPPHLRGDTDMTQSIVDAGGAVESGPIVHSANL